MIRTIAPACLFALALWACTDTPPANPAANTLQPTPQTPVKTYRGLYRSGSRGKVFFDCTNTVMYRVDSTSRTFDSLYNDACQPAPYDNEPVYAVVQGRAGMQDNNLEINRIDTICPRDMHTTCLLYDFWCVGTEPFWGLVISEREGGYFLKKMDEEAGHTFPWSAPIVDDAGKLWQFSAENPSTREKIDVVIRKGACSDGMSDRQYPYSVEVKLNGRTLHGCAIR